MRGIRPRRPGRPGQPGYPPACVICLSRQKTSHDVAAAAVLRTGSIDGLACHLSSSANGQPDSSRAGTPFMLLTTGRPVLRRRRSARRRRPLGKSTCIVHSRPRCWRRDGHHEAATAASLTKSALPRNRGQSGHAPSPCRLTAPMHPARRPLPQRLLHEARVCRSFRRGTAQIRPVATVPRSAPPSRPEPCVNAPRTSGWPRPRSWPVRSN